MATSDCLSGQQENTKGQCTGYEIRIGRVRTIKCPFEDNGKCKEYGCIAQKEIHESEIVKLFQQIASKWAFQLEKGEKNGYEHFQGRIRLIKKKGAKAAENLIPKEFRTAGYYIRPTTNDEFKSSNFNYVLKLDTRIAGPWTDKDYKATLTKETLRQLRPLEQHGMHPFQMTMMQWIEEEPDLRTLKVVYQKKGKVGKSTIITQLLHTKKAYYIPLCNDYTALVQAVCNIVEELDTDPYKYPDPRAFVIDIPKAFEAEKLYNLYVALENIKDGRVWDFRNRYRFKLFHTPHIIIMTNQLPPPGVLSQDRIKVYTVNEQLEMVPYVEPLHPDECMFDNNIEEMTGLKDPFVEDLDNEPGYIEAKAEHKAKIETKRVQKKKLQTSKRNSRQPL